MAKIVCYTSPARGHLYPTMPILLELKRRGHEVLVVTLADEVARVSATGLRARAMAPAVERIVMDDYRGSSQAQALDRGVAVFVARAGHEIPDLRDAIAQERPDLLLVDFNCWGAAAAAEASGLPWALFLPYFLPWRLPGLPPFGPGLAPRSDVWGKIRDVVVGKAVFGLVNRNLGKLNDLRASVGLRGLAHMTDAGRTAPRILHYTAEPFEYACPERPETVIPIGPMSWEPPAASPEWLERVDRPIVLVTCSTEYQDDGKLVSAALAGLADEDVFVVATTAAVDPTGFSAPKNAIVERFVAHGAVLKRAVCVVCHGGMGITQKALAAGVPVCVVPFGRDQLEVARHVEVALAGVRLPRNQLSPRRLRDAVAAARARTAGAERIGAAFHAAGGAARGADELERLVQA